MPLPEAPKLPKLSEVTFLTNQMQVPTDGLRSELNIRPLRETTYSRQFLTFTRAMQRILGHFPNGDTAEGSIGYQYAKPLIELYNRTHANLSDLIMFDSDTIGRKVLALWNAIAEQNCFVVFRNLGSFSGLLIPTTSNIYSEESKYLTTPCLILSGNIIESDAEDHIITTASAANLAHLFSIYTEMKTKNPDFSPLYINRFYSITAEQAQDPMRREQFGYEGFYKFYSALRTCIRNSNLS